MAYGDNFKVYGPYKKQNGRSLVIVIDRHGVRRTVSFPKWLYELHIGKKLDIDSTIDHIDYDIDNNDLNNLRVVPRAEHSADDTRRVKHIKLKCSWCDKEFERSPRLIRDKSKKQKAGPFCSRKCAGKYARRLQLKLIDKLEPQPYIESEYYRRKNMVATASFELNIIDYLFEIGTLDIL